MWLNGPTQWGDHKIGKKHKKNVKNGGANKTSSTTGTSMRSETPSRGMGSGKQTPPPLQPPGDSSSWPAHNTPNTNVAAMGETHVMAQPPPPPLPSWVYPVSDYPYGPPQFSGQYAPYPDTSAWPFRYYCQSMAQWPSVEQPIYQYPAEPEHGDAFTHQ